MGTTKNQSNQNKSDTTQPEESNKESASIPDAEEDSELRAVENPNASEEGEAVSSIEEVVIHPKESKQAPNVETLYLDDSKVGIRYDNYPLSSSVIKALDELGHRYLSRYQQSLFDLLTLGKDRWFSINLASNRGLIIGTYLVDLAQTDLTKTTVVLCVAVPKIRTYFKRDLLSIAKYTGVKILCVDDELSENCCFEEQPNIVIASIEMITRLTHCFDMSGIEVLYFDEVEKTIRDAEDKFVDFVEQHSIPQVVLQSSYYSESLIESVHRCKPKLDPTRLYKRHQTMPDAYVYNPSNVDENWQTFLQLTLPKVLLSRMVVITSDGPIVSQWLARKGWDVVDKSLSQSLESKDLDALRENRTQILVVNKQVFAETKSIEFDVLVSLDVLKDEDERLLLKNKRIQAIFLYKEPQLAEPLSSLEIQPLSEFDGESNRSECIVHSLRQNSLRELNTDWTGLVDDILEQVDGRQLLGEALRLAMQSLREQQGYIRSIVYKSDNKDVFQRRNRKRTK